ncbi:MAG: SUMF1/EgtB/PvdO family nonheme iron enzyme [Anaerolineae bacterium]
MPALDYIDLDLEIARVGTGYRAAITNSPAGQASTEFKLPFAEYELENLLLQIGGRRRSARSAHTKWEELDATQRLGGKLFDAVFDSELKGVLKESQHIAEEKGRGLRIRLRLTHAPELTDLPWEYLYDHALDRFLALSVETPLVRYLELPARIRPLTVQLPLRILVMISSPTDYDPLDVEGEYARLNKALAAAQAQGLVTLTRLEEASLLALTQCLQQDEFHVLHFIGHGIFDKSTQQGLLLMEDAQHKGHLVRARNLGMMLHDHRSLRLVVLNACEGARSASTDPLVGAAPSLVQQGIPAVIAMQFEISDPAAIVFSQGFYGALVKGYPVDGALAEARKTMYAAGNELEWGTPVLFMRAPDGRIFDVAERQAKREAELKARQEAEAEAERQAELKAQQEAAAEAKRQAELKAQQEAEAEAERQAELKAQQEAAAEAKRQAKLKARQEAEAKAKRQAELKARQEAEAKRKAEAVALEKKRAAGLVLELAAGVMLELVRVGAREFLMGTTPEQAAAVIKNGNSEWKRRGAREQPQHKVYLDEYLIGKYPVTVAQFAAFAKATGHKAVGDVQKKGNHPATNVSWDDAVAFCKWASEVTKRAVRLPTEAEWEKAARGTGGRVYPWGDPFDKRLLNSSEGENEGTTPVGSYPGGASPYDALDMAGNVWEWCADWFAEDYYKNSPMHNPTGPTTGDDRVIRGGAFNYPQSNARCAYRSWCRPYSTSSLQGFRVVAAPVRL